MTLIPASVRSLLAQLELISHGSTASWNPAGGHSEPAALPFGESRPPHLTLRDKYLEQDDDAGRTRVVDLMHKELREARGHVDRSQVVGETREQEDARILKEGAGFEADEVARRFNCTPTRVRRLRQAESLDTLGRKTDDLEIDNVDREQKAWHMKHVLGMSEARIAFALGEHRTTVTRWLKKAA